MRSKTAGTSGRRTRSTLLLGAAALVVAGCSAPPSVTPLLRVTRSVLHEESQRLAADAARIGDRYERQRAELAAAFERDLREREELDEAWVGEAVRVYVAAREAVAAQADAERAGYANRIDNLAAASEAQERAIALLEHHRRLLPWPEPFDGWELRDRAADVFRLPDPSADTGAIR